MLLDLPPELYEAIVSELDLQGLTSCLRLGLFTDEIEKRLGQGTEAYSLMRDNTVFWLESVHHDQNWTHVASNYYMRPLRALPNSDTMLEYTHNKPPIMDSFIENPRYETQCEGEKYICEINPRQWQVRCKTTGDNGGRRGLFDLGIQFNCQVVEEDDSFERLDNVVESMEDATTYQEWRYARDKPDGRHTKQWSVGVNGNNSFDRYTLQHSLESPQTYLLPCKSIFQTMAVLEHGDRADLHSLQHKSFEIGKMHRRHYNRSKSRPFTAFQFSNARLVNGRIFWLDDDKLMAAIRYRPANVEAWAKFDEYTPKVEAVEVLSSNARFSRIVAANQRHLVVAYGPRNFKAIATAFALVDAINWTVKIYLSRPMPLPNVICGLVGGELAISTYSNSALDFILAEALDSEEETDIRFGSVLTAEIMDIPQLHNDVCDVDDDYRSTGDKSDSCAPEGDATSRDGDQEGGIDDVSFVHPEH